MASPLRYGIDYRSALVNREGIGRYTRELVRALTRLDLREELGLFGYTLAAPRFSREELGIAGTRAELARLRLPSRLLPLLMRGLRRGADDLVGGCRVYHHTQPNLLPVRVAREVVTIFDCIYMNRNAGYMEPAAALRMERTARELVRRATTVLVPCAYVGAEVVMSLGARPEQVAITPLGCDHILRTPPDPARAEREPYILTVCRVDPRKNHLRMLWAFERLVQDGYAGRWIVAGPAGWGCESFEQALSDSPARARVVWRRNVPEAELPGLYAGADVFLFASLSEGFGLPPLEAMACGAPVVTSCVTSLPEVCGDAAVYVEPTSVEEVFDGARRVLSDAELARELVERGRARAAELTWEACARSTLLAYRRAAQA